MIYTPKWPFDIMMYLLCPWSPFRSIIARWGVLIKLSFFSLRVMNGTVASITVYFLDSILFTLESFLKYVILLLQALCLLLLSDGFVFYLGFVYP